jgi:hypothetical protein
MYYNVKSILSWALIKKSFGASGAIDACGLAFSAMMYVVFRVWSLRFMWGRLHAVFVVPVAVDIDQMWPGQSRSQ